MSEQVRAYVGPAVLIHHAPPADPFATPISWFRAGPARPWGGHGCAVFIFHSLPRRRWIECVTVLSNATWYTVETDQGTIYDSRLDVPPLQVFSETVDPAPGTTATRRRPRPLARSTWRRRPLLKLAPTHSGGDQ